MNHEDKAKALLDRVLAGFNAGDVDAIADCFHSEVSAEFPFAPPGMPAVSSGHAAVMASLREGRASLAEMTITPTKLYWCPADATLFVEATSQGRLQNGADYRNRYVFVVGIRDDRVVLWREYFNSLVILQAFEAMAAGPAA